MRSNLILDADAYTISGGVLISDKAKEGSLYNFTNRTSPATAIPEVAKDGRMVLYGVSDFVEQHLLNPVTMEDVEEAAEFMSSANVFGGPLPFDEERWRRIVTEFGGYLPIIICGLPEGSTFFKGEPVIQVAAREGFGDFAAHIEALMVGMVSNLTARVTISRHWLQRFYEKIKDYTTLSDKDAYNLARLQVADFGARAASCQREMELYASAHLLCFDGTDSFGGARHARRLGCKGGKSVLALAHRIVQSYPHEGQAYENLSEVCGDYGSIGSYVSDCYDFKTAIDTHIVELAKRNPNKVYVARPDSGVAVDNILYICRTAVEHGLFTTDEKGLKCATNLRFIEGDSVNPKKVEEIQDKMLVHGYNPVQWGIYGCGGYLANRPNRDLFSSAYKLAAVGDKFDTRVCKFSDTPAKRSVPGMCSIQDVLPPRVYLSSKSSHQNSLDDYTYYYKGSSYREPWQKIQNRVMNEFNVYSNVDDSTTLSEEVIAEQDRLEAKHKRLITT